MPKRIQLKRTKGWRKPEGATVVARPTKWGNPFDFRAAADVGYGDGRGAAVDAFSGWLRGEDWGVPQEQTCASMAAKRVAIRRSLHELAGKDLACWCPLDQPCHADVLIRLANQSSYPPRRPTCFHSEFQTPRECLPKLKTSIMRWLSLMKRSRA